MYIKIYFVNNKLNLTNKLLLINFQKERKCYYLRLTIKDYIVLSLLT